MNDDFMNDDFLYAYIDFARVAGSWPGSQSAQSELLEKIDPCDWHRSTLMKVHGHVARHGHRRIVKLTLDVGFGMRWFDVWADPSGSQLLVMKRQAPKTSVVVAVELQPHPEGIGAVFSLMSGRVLGATIFTGISAETPLFVKNLRGAASERALFHGLLETHRQRVNLALPGFDSDPPNGLLLWARPEATVEGLEAWLALVRPLPPAHHPFNQLPTSPENDSSGLEDTESSSDWGPEVDSDEETVDSEGSRHVRL